MKLHNEPAAEIVLSKLGKVPPVLHDVLDKATTQARSFFGEDQEIDTALFPDLVRYYAKELLQDPKYKSIGYVLAILNKNGLLLIYEQDGCIYKIRVRKADEDGELPIATLSTKMKEHLKQPNLFLPGMEIQDLEEKYVSPSLVKLVVVWDCDSSFTLTDVWLACFRNEMGATHFVGEIPHSATTITAPSVFDDIAEELDDLDITLEETGSASE
jgi:hypothetical protein